MAEVEETDFELALAMLEEEEEEELPNSGPQQLLPSSLPTPANQVVQSDDSSQDDDDYEVALEEENFDAALGEEEQGNDEKQLPCSAGAANLNLDTTGAALLESTVKGKPAKEKKAPAVVGKKRAADTAPTGGKAPKLQKIRDGVEDLLLQWFNKHNRPLSVQSAVDALGSRVAKPLVLKALETLVEQKLVQVRDIKKARFYFLPQATLHCLSNEERAAKEQRLKELAAEVARAESEVQAVAATIHREANAMSVEELTVVVEKEKDAVRSLQQRLGKLQRGANGAAATTSLKDLAARYVALRAEWKKRKEWANGIAGCMAHERTEAAIFEQVGAATDEDVGVSLDDGKDALPSKYWPAAVSRATTE